MQLLTLVLISLALVYVKSSLVDGPHSATMTGLPSLLGSSLTARQREVSAAKRIRCAVFGTNPVATPPGELSSAAISPSEKLVGLRGASS
jgi:hypothetical protein